MPQPVRSTEDFFSVLAAPKKFVQDLKTLEKRFYEASRALHPDRFTTASIDAKKASLERMSLLNDAYRTLRSRSETRDYILEQAGLTAAGLQTKSGTIPMELAESWFDLQDALVEDPEHAAVKIGAFQIEVQAFKSKALEELEALEKALDASEQTLDSEKLRPVYTKAQALNYVNSLERDLSRRRAS
jgi:molecular chaperone HscB